MNYEYLEKLFKEHKKTFNEYIDMESPEDLKQLLIDYMVSNLQFDFDIDLDIVELFKK